MASSRSGGGPDLVVEWEVDEALEAAVDRPFLETVLSAALAGRHSAKSLAVGLVVTDDEGIRELNLRHRGLDAPTDVLSFPLLEYEEPERPKPGFPLPPGQPVSLGDLVLSHERAVEQAAEYGHSLERELAFLVVHGAMHLLGYDHEDPADRERMRREEEAVLRRLDLSR